MPPLIDVDTASTFCASILQTVGIDNTRGTDCDFSHAAAQQAVSGLVNITGDQHSTALLCPVPLASCADGLLHAFELLVARNALGDTQGFQLLDERAAFSGRHISGRQSLGGSCRLLDASDGVIALSLARDSDWGMLPGCKGV
ncbi:MAG: hypothetical protein ACI9GW_001464 [Halieaceae bacterium]|jgi:hypothetical protein